MNKILIVGGAGYVGGYLTDYLLEQGYDVTVYDNLTYETRFLKDVKFVFGDIRDTCKLKAIINDYDGIIWLAAVVGDGACEVDKNLTFDVNDNSVRWFTDNYSGKKVFLSTCSVYGVNNDLIDEEADPNPISTYASTKLSAEQYLLQKDPSALAYRLGTLFGVGDSFSRIRLDLVVNILSKKATCGEKLTVYGGEQWRPLLHVRDVAGAIDFGLKNDICGLYNLSYKNYKIYEIAEEIQKVNPHTEIIYQDIKFEDLRNYKVKTDKMLSTGWTAKYDLSFGIKQIERIIKENRIVNTSDPVYSNVAYLSKIWR